MLDHESEVCFRTHIKMLCRWHDWKNRMNTTAVVCCCCCLDHWLITKVPLLMATGCCTPMRHCDCYPYLFLVNTRGALNVVQPTIWVTINPGMCQSINWSFLTDETPEIGCSCFCDQHVVKKFHILENIFTSCGHLWTPVIDHRLIQ